MLLFEKKLSGIIDAALRAIDSENQGWLTKEQVALLAEKSADFNMEPHRLRDIFDDMIIPPKHQRGNANSGRAMINQLRERILAEAFPNALHELVGLAILSIPSRGDAPISNAIFLICENLTCEFLIKFSVNSPNFKNMSVMIIQKVMTINISVPYKNIPFSNLISHEECFMSSRKNLKSQSFQTYVLANLNFVQKRMR